jgi:undecaprenyl-diphosphatase
MRLALVTQILDWIRPVFASAGYVIVSAATFFETAALIGLIVPGDVVLALGGVYAGEKELKLGWVIACGALFGVLGSTVGFSLGRRYGNRLLRRVPLIRRFEGRLAEAEISIRANAGRTIAIGRFVTGAGGFVPFVAGTSRVPPKTFFVYTVPTICVWATAITLLGYFVGDNVETIDKILRRVGLFGLTLAAIVVGTWWWHRRRGQPPPAPPAEP